MTAAWDLAATNLHTIARHQYEVAVLPVGATEAHNRHLPEGQDVFLATHVARRCCQTAWDRCQSVVCLPTLPYGVDCNLMAFPMTVHVSQATLDATVRDIVLSLRRHGIRKVVLVNGHGGNDFVSFARQMQADSDVHVFLCNWWQVGQDRYEDIFDEPDDHAGELETSVALAVHPELVDLAAAGDGRARPFRFEALQRGWVHTSRDFSKLNDHCGVGDPSRASAEKGRAYLDVVCGRLSAFLVQLAETPIDEHFPHPAD
ncbi:MAG: creatininase family protein [bacterium]|nr:creatininase family protein [bacterium]